MRGGVLFKPEWHSGQKVFRGVEMTPDGINHENTMLLFPPSIVQGRAPVLTLAELNERAAKHVQMVVDKDAPPKLAHQVHQLVLHMRKLLKFWIKLSAANERNRCLYALEKQGLLEAKHVLMGLNDG